MVDETMQAHTPGAPAGQALDRWCQDTWRQLYHFVYHRVQSRQEAEDITQETYARILASNGPANPPPSRQHLQTVALNLIRDRWRRQTRRGTQVSVDESTLLGEHGLERLVDQNWVRELVAQLSEDHRTVLRLRIVEGYSRGETAKYMGRSEDSVRGLQYRAVQALRDLMHTSLKEGDGR